MKASAVMNSLYTQPRRFQQVTNRLVLVMFIHFQWLLFSFTISWEGPRLGRTGPGWKGEDEGSKAKVGTVHYSPENRQGQIIASQCNPSSEGWLVDTGRPDVRGGSHEELLGAVDWPG